MKIFIILQKKDFGVLEDINEIKNSQISTKIWNHNKQCNNIAKEIFLIMLCSISWFKTYPIHIIIA